MTVVSPDMRELRGELDLAGVPYEIDDDDDDVYGLQTHIERTGITSRSGRWVSVIYAWSRDEDGDKRFESDGGRFGYLEMQVDEGDHRAVTVEEVMEVVMK